MRVSVRFLGRGREVILIDRLLRVGRDVGGFLRGKGAIDVVEGK